jgi:hypothetical protein
MSSGYADFRKKFDDSFFSLAHRNSVAHQLVDLTDLFQKISAIYQFARAHKNTALHNPIMFQIVESALLYGVCMQIRRLAKGKQHNEISLFKLISEIRANCEHWSRHDFVTWDGAPYDAKELYTEHRKEEARILDEMEKRGESGGWLPIGKHEKVWQRHAIFDTLSSNSEKRRLPSDVWSRCVPDYLLKILVGSASDVLRFANEYLAHRVHLPIGRRPAFNISLDEIEKAALSLWKCYNTLDSIFKQNYMTPNIIHSLGVFDKLELPVVDASDEHELIHFYEEVKARMEEATAKHSHEWQSLFSSDRTAAE